MTGHKQLRQRSLLRLRAHLAQTLILNLRKAQDLGGDHEAESEGHEGTSCALAKLRSGGGLRRHRGRGEPRRLGSRRDLGD
jgi:hypothetical protein